MRTRCTKTLSIRLPGLTAGPGATATFSVIACNVCFQAAAGLIATADMGRKRSVRFWDEASQKPSFRWAIPAAPKQRCFMAHTVVFSLHL